MASRLENRKFAEALLPSNLLDDVIDWIQANMAPEDIFSKKQLEQWASDSGYTLDP